MQKKYILTILGGTDGFGKWLASFILKEFPNQVDIIVTGNNKEKGSRVSRELGVQFLSDNTLAVQGADVVIYSVPIAYTSKVIEDTIDYIKPGAVLSDVTSIKKFPSKAMKLCKQKGVVVIPTHPMFGPYISSIAGQVCVLTAEQEVRQTKEYIFLKNYLKSQKSKVVESTPEHHDKMMAVVQGLTHLNMFVVGETMKRLGFSIMDSMDFVSPIYKIMVSSVGRYLGQNPGLYADIQMYNDEVLTVHEKFLDTANNFHQSVKNKDYDKFCSDIVAAREFLGEDNCQNGQEYTDKIIYLLGRQIDILKNNIGKKITLKNIYSGENISGILEEYKDGNILFPGGNIYKIDEHEVIAD